MTALKVILTSLSRHDDVNGCVGTVAQRVEGSNLDFVLQVEVLLPHERHITVRSSSDGVLGSKVRS